MEKKATGELSPVVTYVVIAVVVVGLAVVGYMVFGRGGYRAQTAPTGDVTQSAPAKGYKPPTGAPVRIGPGGGGPGGMPPMSGPPGGMPRMSGPPGGIPGGQPPGR